MKLRMTGRCRLDGLTIVELLVAIIMAAILTTAVYFTWQQLTLQTETQKRKTMLRAESIRVVNMIASRLRRADAVIKQTRYSVIFSSDNKVDTISYHLTDGTLLFNTKPLGLSRKSLSVSNFSIENGNQDDPDKPYLLTCTVGISTTSGDTASAKTTVFVHRAQNSAQDMFSW